MACLGCRIHLPERVRIHIRMHTDIRPYQRCQVPAQRFKPRSHIPEAHTKSHNQPETQSRRGVYVTVFYVPLGPLQS